ncbi:hypothetical protein RWX45_07730, partial [Actinomyces sp. MRS3W]|nr:hypothetical protein [Actinomyces sp. MRS3W]
TLAVAEPSRRAWFDGGVDVSWPVSPLVVRLGHLLVPAAVMTVWAAAALGAYITSWTDLGMVLAAGCGWGGVALRSGFRPSPNFSLGLVSTPVGAVPPGAVEMLISGPDAALIAGLPGALVAAGWTTTPLLVVQLAASAVVVTWGLLTGRRAR